MKKVPLLLCSLTLLCVAGCAENLATSNYSTQEAARASKTVPAKIVSIRPVTINTNTGVGGLAGTVIGATAGSAIGGDTRTNIIGGAAGAVAGGVLGNAIEKGVSKNQGLEITMKLRDGSYTTVTQLAEKNVYLSVGQKVLIIYGEKTRVVPDTTGT